MGGGAAYRPKLLMGEWGGELPNVCTMAYAIGLYSITQSSRGTVS